MIGLERTYESALKPSPFSGYGGVAVYERVGRVAGSGLATTMHVPGRVPVQWEGSERQDRDSLRPLEDLARQRRVPPHGRRRPEGERSPSRG